MRKWLFRLFLIINLLVASALVLSYAAKYFSPSLSLIIALAGMAYSFLLSAFLILTIFLLIIKKHKWLLLNILIILLGWNNLTAWIQFNPTLETQADFRVMSYNVKLFGLYDWKNNIENKAKMIAFIKESKPDVVCFQEFYYDNKKFPIDSVCTALNMPYYYVTDSRFINEFEHFGQAIFSKFPIKNSKIIQFPNTTNMSLYCDIEIKKGELVRVFSNHLESYRFQSDDYELVEDLKQKRTDLDKVPGLLDRLEVALVKRSYQADKIASIVNSSPYPAIVTGDFNDTPNSYSYYQISRYLSDAFIENGRGFSNTYKGSFPSFRIDFILYSEGIKSVSYQRLKYEGSDHYPIYSDFIFEK